ncbi:hypothetical protein GRX03_09025 [Halovenus sp. WSH3]|uniref:Uncharacterized protein n=1 Tax=Halovenus carboxidivorans TaxID=2692199 RepID=A0A6B0T101_9EURY|nr:hypothetical protein [Halovenus carboxidivorans]MXR51744.1 hypothetical protein [Halovenus carboxidivorans]
MDDGEPAETSTSPAGISQDTFELAREELQRTFEYQVQRLREIDAKAIEILKANLLLFGLVVTGGSIFVQTAITIEPFLNVFILVGVGLLLLSTALAGITYTSSNLRGGLDAQDIERAIAAEYGEHTRDFREQLLRSYAQWIEYNARMTAVNDILATVTVLLVIVAFAYIGVGLVVGIVAPGTLVTAAVFVGQTAVLGWLTRLIYHMDHLAPPPTETIETFDGVMISKGASREEGLVALWEMLRGSNEE